MKRGYYESVDDITSDVIDTFSGSTLDFSFGLLRAVEKSLWGDLSVAYLTIEDDNTILSFMPVYYGTNVNINALLPEKFQEVYNKIVDFIGSSIKTTFLISGSLISDKGWIPLLDGCDSSRVVGEMVDYIDKFSRSLNVKVCMVKDIHMSFPDVLMSKIEAQGFTKLYSLPTVIINTDFKDFDGYAASLSKNARKHARKVEKSADDKFEFQVIQKYSHMIDDIFPLFRSTYLKARYQFDEATPRFFYECSLSENPKTELIVCRYNGVIVGALINFYNDDEQLNKRIGIDYRCEHAPLIYTSLMYKGIRSAIEKDVKKVYLGQSTYVPKIRLGGEIEDEYFYVKAYDPLLRISMPWQKKYSENFKSERVLSLAAEGVSV